VINDNRGRRDEPFDQDNGATAAAHSTPVRPLNGFDNGINGTRARRADAQRERCAGLAPNRSRPQGWRTRRRSDRSGIDVDPAAPAAVFVGGFRAGTRV